MRMRIVVSVLACAAAAGALNAGEFGTATGKGTIERPVAASTNGETEKVPFAPRFSWTYSEGSGPKRSTWIVLTEKEPPVEAWIAAKDREEARRVWCGKEKTPFAAVKLDAERKVDLYFLCPADGGVDTRMVSSWNGLESVVLHFDVHDAKRLKGTLRTGEGSCPAGEHGEADYCTKTGDYAFDAPIAR